VHKQYLADQGCGALSNEVDGEPPTCKITEYGWQALLALGAVPRPVSSLTSLLLTSLLFYYVRQIINIVQKRHWAFMLYNRLAYPKYFIPEAYSDDKDYVGSMSFKLCP